MKSFVFEQQVQHVYRIDFLSVTLDYRAQCPVVEQRGQNLGHLRFLLFLARLHEVQKSYCSHPGRMRSRSRHTLLKFSRSLYLDNQLSESIHTWTIGTL